MYSLDKVNFLFCSQIEHSVVYDFEGFTNKAAHGIRVIHLPVSLHIYNACAIYIYLPVPAYIYNTGSACLQHHAAFKVTLHVGITISLLHYDSQSSGA